MLPESGKHFRRDHLHVKMLQNQHSDLSGIAGQGYNEVLLYF